MAGSRRRCELCEVVGGADHRPFGSRFLDPAREELPKAPGLLDLTEHRLDDLFSEPVPASPSCPFQLFARGLGERPPIFRLTRERLRRVVARQEKPRTLSRGSFRLNVSGL